MSEEYLMKNVQDTMKQIKDLESELKTMRDSLEQIKLLKERRGVNDTQKTCEGSPL